jgi:hypothetical protein
MINSKNPLRLRTKSCVGLIDDFGLHSSIFRIRFELVQFFR